MTHQRSMVWSVTTGCGVDEILSSALLHLSFLPSSCGRVRVRAVRVSWSVAAAEEWERLWGRGEIGMSDVQLLRNCRIIWKCKRLYTLLAVWHDLMDVVQWRIRVHAAKAFSRHYTKWSTLIPARKLLHHRRKQFVFFRAVFTKTSKWWSSNALLPCTVTPRTRKHTVVIFTASFLHPYPPTLFPSNSRQVFPSRSNFETIWGSCR